MQTLEGKTIVVARRLTRNVKQSVTTVSGYLPTKFQPTAVKERLENAVKYSEELYESFRKVYLYTYSLTHLVKFLHSVVENIDSSNHKTINSRLNTDDC